MSRNSKILLRWKVWCGGHYVEQIAAALRQWPSSIFIRSRDYSENYWPIRGFEPIRGRIFSHLKQNLKPFTIMISLSWEDVCKNTLTYSPSWIIESWSSNIPSSILGYFFLLRVLYYLSVNELDWNNLVVPSCLLIFF